MAKTPEFVEKVVTSTRIRLARNLAGYPFPERLTETLAEEVLFLIEIAPILGLSDVIVDIVETGTTLKENDLEVKETIVPISARLIANKASYKFKTEEIERIGAALAKRIPE